MNTEKKCESEVGIELGYAMQLVCVFNKEEPGLDMNFRG